MMACLLVFCLLSLPMGPHGFVLRSPSNIASCRPFRFSRLHSGGKVNVAEHELPLDHTNAELPSTLSDDDLKIVAKYRQLLAKQFPATMVRHTMVKDGNDKPEILRSVFEELGDDEISKMTKPANKIRRKARAVQQGLPHSRPAYEDPTGFFPSRRSRTAPPTT